MSRSKGWHDQHHKWPRGYKKKLIDLDGDKCFFCWSQQKPFHIAHIADMEQEGTHFYPYLPENCYSSLYTVLLCASCHMKVDTTWCHSSPFFTAFMKVFRERRERIKSQQQNIDQIEPTAQDMKDCFAPLPRSFDPFAKESKP